MMSIFTEKDATLTKKHIKDIIKLTDKKREQILMGPIMNDINAINNIVIDFVKENKRKIYGSYALNLLIVDRDPKDAILEKDTIPDIDFYSPDPIRDMMALCNLLHKKKYSNILGKEAQHQGTFKITVNNINYCDITYVPKNIYHKMPFREVNGMTLTGPELMIIDYFRLATDLLISAWRLEKTMSRFPILLKHFPIPKINKQIRIPPAPDNPKLVKKLMDDILMGVADNSNCIMVGFYAYNHFVYAADSKLYNHVEVPYYEIVATDYRKDAAQIIQKLKDSNKEHVGDIKCVEHYPFFQLWGHSVMVYYKQTLIAHIFSNNKLCVAYKTVRCDTFDNRKRVANSSDQNININIGSFSIVVLYGLIAAFKARVDQDMEIKSLYFIFVSHLIDLRNHFMASKNKSILDDTIFQEFVMDCKGRPVLPEIERAHLIALRKKQGVRLTVTYDPAQGNKNKIPYDFPNTSGNAINNPKNFKLVGHSTVKPSAAAENSDTDSDNKSEPQLDSQ